MDSSAINGPSEHNNVNDIGRKRKDVKIDLTESVGYLIKTRQNKVQIFKQILPSTQATYERTKRCKTTETTRKTRRTQNSSREVAMLN